MKRLVDIIIISFVLLIGVYGVNAKHELKDCEDRLYNHLVESETNDKN